MNQRETAEQFFYGKKVLITGGLGFIGSNLALRMVRIGADVSIVDSLLPEHGGNYFNIEPVKSHVKLHISDLRFQDSLAPLVEDKHYIFHLAGQVSHGDSMREPELDLAINCAATLNLLEVCRKLNPQCRLVFTSTRQVYGIPQELPVKEDHPAKPIDINGVNKLTAECYHLLYDHIYGLRSAVLRLTNTYGPRQQIRNDRQGFIGIFIRQALKGETIRIFGTGEQVRDFNYIDDVIEAILLAAFTEKCYGKVLNLGARIPNSILDLVSVLNDLCGVKYLTIPFPIDRRIIDIGNFHADYSKFNAITGWEPKTELYTGMAQTIEFYNKNAKEFWT